MIDWLKDEQFNVDIPGDEAIFTMNIVCRLIDIQYWTLHQLVEEGLISPQEQSKRKKLFSYNDVKKLKYIKYLMNDRGVNISGIKVIFEIDNKDE